jgi:hypothetical protein
VLNFLHLDLFVNPASQLSRHSGCLGGHMCTTGRVPGTTHGARVEAINTQMRMITRRAYGFHSAAALIALAMLSLGELCPPLPR